MSYNFSKTEISDKHIKAYADLLSAVFTNTDKFTEDFLKWQYADNPHGTVVGFDAFDGETLAGHYVTIPIVYTINGNKTKGLLSLNTVTHANHRGKGLFTQLANKTYEEAKKMGYQFIIGVANQNSTHGFLKKLGFYLVAPLTVKTGIGSIRYNKELNYVAKPIWTNETLSWRLKNPEGTYYKAGNNVISKTDKAMFHALLYNGNNKLETLSTKQPLFKLWMGLAKDLKNFGLFINLPEKLKPSPLNLIFKDLTGDLPNLGKDDILFESIDFDGF